MHQSGKSYIMIKINLSSKAKTLEDLSGVIEDVNILPLYRFYVSEFKENELAILNHIQGMFDGDLIVRSSSANEDNLNTSAAGIFDSVLNVNINSNLDIKIAINKVVSSYGTQVNDKDEVFVQPMLKNVCMSGVVFSADLDTLSSYYIVNYDESGSTSTVTSGDGNNLKTYICTKKNNNVKNPKLYKIIEATKKCEVIFDCPFLDIEFAFSGDDFYIFQVRQIVVKNKENLSAIDLSGSLKKIYKKIKKLNGPHPNLLGNRTILGVMPDWNPAEIIGIRPKNLALSLYKELITDETWAFQRDNYGYRNLRSHPLLISLLGVPYIDVRVSFNSFIPKTLNNELSSRMVNYYLDRLSENTKHHDKVEFEIIFSCYYFGISQQLNKLKKYGFSDADLSSVKSSLLELTNNVINVKSGLYVKDLAKIEILKTKYIEIKKSELPLLDKIYWLIKDVKRYGTLPFAGIARAGFIAVQLLRSFIDEGIFTQDEYDRYLTSLKTVSKKMSIDVNRLSKVNFLTEYGHLRPGTYDISSSNYEDAYDLYFDDKHNNYISEVEDFNFSEKQISSIEKLILFHGLDTTYQDLMTFIKASIEGREYVKFTFTKSLNLILKYIQIYGCRFGFETDDIAHLDIQSLLTLYSKLDNRDMEHILGHNIKQNKDFYQYTKALKLPSVIVSAGDVYQFFQEENDANFITQKKIKSKVVLEKDISHNNIEGRIICIKSADPGYDYLFSKNISGLITCYGGANSHMAIRCAEMGIPAVIGCGENSFVKYCSAKIVEIDAENKQVKILS